MEETVVACVLNTCFRLCWVLFLEESLLKSCYTLEEVKHLIESLNNQNQGLIIGC